jgi:RNA polymerase sigma-70 factor (ECF subfamily)
MPSLAEQHAVFEEDADSGIRRVVSHGGGAVRPSWPELVVLVRAQVRSLVGATRDLEDLTQATLEQVVRALPRFEGRCELSTFTYSIASRIVMNHWRSISRYLRRFVLGIDDIPEPADPTATDPSTFADRERVARLHHHLEGLPADQRLVVVLFDLEELPASRIAEIVDCPEPTVRSRLKRGRAALAKKLIRDPLFADDVRGDLS